MEGKLPVVVLLQAEDEAQESDSSGGSSGQSDGLARSGSKKRKRGNKKQPRSAIGVSAEAITEVEGDEPAELMTMQSVSHLCLKLHCNYEVHVMQSSVCPSAQYGHPDIQQPTISTTVDPGGQQLLDGCQQDSDGC